MLDYILDLTKDILSDTKKMSKKDKEIIRDKVLYAIGQTKAHINSTRKKDKDKPSTVLANIWQRTASQIKIVKNPKVQNLVHTIEQKSKYWYDPDGYDKELFDKYKMRLSQVEATLDNL